MDFSQAITEFANGGRNEVLFLLMPSALLACILAAFSFKMLSGGYALGLGGTLLVIGLILAGHGVGVYRKYVKWEHTALQSYQADHRSTVLSEIERMKDYKKYTKQNLAGAGIIICVSLIFIFLLNFRWLSGIGTGLIFICFFTLMMEGGFSEIRSAKYIKALDAFVESLQSAPKNRFEDQ